MHWWTRCWRLRARSGHKRPEMADRILLGQLGAHGDCLYATILARQLRRDYPSAFITWAISDRSSGLLANNPDIDEVWEIPVDRDSMPVIWSIFEREADLPDYFEHFAARAYALGVNVLVWVMTR